jgi:hypothetical protein
VIKSSSKKKWVIKRQSVECFYGVALEMWQMDFYNFVDLCSFMILEIV